MSNLFAAARDHYKISLAGHSNKVHLTGHSHRLWSDRVIDARKEYVDLSANSSDHKWDKIFERAQRFRLLVASRVGITDPSRIGFDQNTYNLVYRVFSCFDRPKIVTTTSEFHSLTRGAAALPNSDVTFVDVYDRKNMAQKIIDAITEGTNIVAVSTTFFDDGFSLPDVHAIVAKARSVGVVVILDAYHQYNIRPMDIDSFGLEGVFVVAGHYKYGGAGEGAAWISVPSVGTYNPRYTGWFAHFEALDQARYPRPIHYDRGGIGFLGATMDYSGIFGAVAALDLFDSLGWDVSYLAQNNIRQVGHLIDALSSLSEEGGLPVNTRILATYKQGGGPDAFGPFLALDVGSSERARRVCTRLASLSEPVLVDSRGNNLRVGPGEYNTDEELDKGMQAIYRVLKEIV